MNTARWRVPDHAFRALAFAAAWTLAVGPAAFAALKSPDVVSRIEVHPAGALRPNQRGEWLETRA